MQTYLDRNRIFEGVAFDDLFFSVMLYDFINTATQKKSVETVSRCDRPKDKCRFLLKSLLHIVETRESSLNSLVKSFVIYKIEGHIEWCAIIVWTMCDWMFIASVNFILVSVLLSGVPFFGDRGTLRIQLQG